MLYRNFNLLIQDIVIVGAGGTGSRIVQPVIQAIKQSQSSINPQLFIVDGDEVEPKNLSRQNFIERDVGHNKAKVLAQRYGVALDFPVVYIDKFITREQTLRDVSYEASTRQDLRNLTGNRKLIIMCVDSVEARLEILSQCNANDVIIDAGNEDTFGQVSIFDMYYPPAVRSDDYQIDLKPFSGDYAMKFIPAPLTGYLNALENPTQGTGSCADLDQSMAINNMMAAGIVANVQNLCFNLPFTYRTSYFNLLDGNSTEKMTPQWFNMTMNESISQSVPRGICNVTSQVVRNDIQLAVQSGAGDVKRAIYQDIASNVTFIDPNILAALNAA